MPIDFSNLLSPNMIVNVTTTGTSSPVHQNASRQKSLTLMQSAGVGNDMYIRFNGKGVRSVVMQQDFENADTMCALISPDGLVTEYDCDGQVLNQGTTEQLGDFVRNAWDQLTPAVNECKSGLVVSSAHWNKYIDHHDNLIAEAYEAGTLDEKGVKSIPHSHVFNKSLRAVYDTAFAPEFIQ